MSKFKIEKVSVVTAKSGTVYRKLNLEDESGNPVEAVAFSTFSQYSNLLEGKEVEGVLEGKEYNGKTSYTLKDAPRGSGGGNKAGFSKEMMETKSKSIEVAQGRKDDSIKMSSTFRDASIITVELLKIDPKLNWKETWLENRRWLYSNYENTTVNAYPDNVLDKPPF